jgi:uncharacterized protein YecE (DUF72 family)
MRIKKGSRLYCGTSNIMLPVRNKTFYPAEYRDKSRLTYYASLLNSLEVNSTFYKLPLPRTVARWVAEVPDDFRFTFKLWRDVTHTKGFLYDDNQIDAFLNAVHPAIAKAGCLLVQFPQSIKFSQIRRVSALLQYLTAHKLYEGWKLAVEFRDASWYNDTVWEMLDKHEAAVVQHDMPKSSTPGVELVAAVAYLRFHGQAGDYRGSYPDDVLADYASYIKQLLKQGKDVYAYFNNTIGDAIHNALDLQKLL